MHSPQHRTRKRLGFKSWMAIAGMGVAGAGLLPVVSPGLATVNYQMRDPQLPLGHLNRSVVTESGFVATTVARGTGGASQPDDVTTMAHHLFVAFQNGIHAKGQPAPNGATASTIVEYGGHGRVLARWNLTGHVDGLTADPGDNRLLATVNEDGNSSFYVIHPGMPAGRQVQHLTYSPAPDTAPLTSPIASGGGPDSITVLGDKIYISASAPLPDAQGRFTHAALFRATISGSRVLLAPALMGNAPATSIATGAATTLNLSDPDSNTSVPASVPGVGGDIVLDSQGDGQLVFVHGAGTPSQSSSMLPLGTQVNDVAFATSVAGTLYVTDTVANKVIAITGRFTPGTAFVAAPHDSGVAGCVGTLDLTRGTIRPFAINMQSPSGMIFVPRS